MASICASGLLYLQLASYLSPMTTTSTPLQPKGLSILQRIFLGMTIFFVLGVANQRYGLFKPVSGRSPAATPLQKSPASPAKPTLLRILAVR